MGAGPVHLRGVTGLPGSREDKDAAAGHGRAPSSPQAPAAASLPGIAEDAIAVALAREDSLRAEYPAWLIWFDQDGWHGWRRGYFWRPEVAGGPANRLCERLYRVFRLHLRAEDGLELPEPTWDSADGPIAGIACRSTILGG
jgi:hypothetical protein